MILKHKCIDAYLEHIHLHARPSATLVPRVDSLLADYTPLGLICEKL
jgi:hypothetical protein